MNGTNTNFDLLYVPTEFKFASTEVSSDLSAISLDKKQRENVKTLETNTNILTFSRIY